MNHARLSSQHSRLVWARLLFSIVTLSASSATAQDSWLKHVYSDDDEVPILVDGWQEGELCDTQGESCVEIEDFAPHEFGGFAQDEDSGSSYYLDYFVAGNSSTGGGRLVRLDSSGDAVDTANFAVEDSTYHMPSFNYDVEDVECCENGVVVTVSRGLRLRKSDSYNTGTWIAVTTHDAADLSTIGTVWLTASATATGTVNTDYASDGAIVVASTINFGIGPLIFVSRLAFDSPQYEKDTSFGYFGANLWAAPSGYQLSNNSVIDAVFAPLSSTGERIYVAGHITETGSSDVFGFVLRLDGDGYSSDWFPVADTSFGSNGFVFVDVGSETRCAGITVSSQSETAYVGCEEYGSSPFADYVVALDSGGDLETSFGTSGKYSVGHSLLDSPPIDLEVEVLSGQTRLFVGAFDADEDEVALEVLDDSGTPLSRFVWDYAGGSTPSTLDLEASSAGAATIGWGVD